MKRNMSTSNIALHHRLREYYERHENRFSIGFFVGGFLFDLKMVERIDSWATIGQQTAYLGLIFLVLIQLFFEQNRLTSNEPKSFILLNWYYKYRVAVIHFFFGTLLNMYTIFFFKSSSLLVSFGFLVGLIFLLYANESHRFRMYGVTFKFALFSVCLLAFSSCMIPIAIGYMGKLVFLFSMIVGSLPLIGLSWWILHYKPAIFERAKTQILLPLACVLAAFVTFYSLRLIPPVPLAIPFIGVYHGVEKSGNQYLLANERPWWRIWHNGDQDFVAQPEDKIFIAFRIFSPTHFSDQVLMRWYWRDNKQGWVLQDSIPIKIVGGREDGFRGYGVKSNYQPGRWKVQVDTTDGREIGRVYFQLQTAAQESRSFEHDIM